MTVGIITNISISAYPTYVNVSFAKPANTTKFVVTITDAINSYISPYQETFSFSSSSVGSTVTCKLTSLNPGGEYYISVTPYNGSTAGTSKQYLNSGSANLVKVPRSTTSSGGASGYNPAAPTTGAQGSGSATPNSATGNSANNGTNTKSTAASANTPTPLTAAVNSPAPSDLNSAGRISLDVKGLLPGKVYDVKVRAVSTDSSGATILSEWSTPLNITTPGLASDGSNWAAPNSSTDIQLLGGSLYAGNFPSNMGLFDPLVNSGDGVTPAAGQVDGSGVILNQWGLAGYNGGTPEFYINSRTGSAYFAGTLSVDSLISVGAVTNTSLSNTLEGYRTTTSIIGAGYITTGTLKSGGYSDQDPTDGSAFATQGTGMAINLDNNSITSPTFRIVGTGVTGQTAGNAYFKGTVYGTNPSTGAGVTIGQSGSYDRLIFNSSTGVESAHISSNSSSFIIDASAPGNGVATITITNGSSGLVLGANPYLTKSSVYGTAGLKNIVAASGSNPYSASLNPGLIVLVY